MIIGFNFSKIDVERNSPVKGKVKISNDFDINDMKEQKFGLSDKKKALNISFNFKVDYKPNIGKIHINGDILYLVEDKKFEEILNSWKTKKKMPKEVTVEILNAVMNKCNVKALELSQELNLPAHIPMPKVNFEKKNIAETYIG